MTYFKKLLGAANGQSGFTLVELVIYMGLLTILIFIFTDIFTSIINNQLSSRNTSNVVADGRYIYSRFIYDVNRADTVLTPSSYGSTSASMVLVINGENYVYSVADNNLLITTSSGTDRINSYGSSINDVLFTKVGTSSARDTIRMNFTVNGTITSGGISNQQKYQTTAGLR